MLSHLYAEAFKCVLEYRPYVGCFLCSRERQGDRQGAEQQNSCGFLPLLRSWCPASSTLCTRARAVRLVWSVGASSTPAVSGPIFARLAFLDTSLAFRSQPCPRPRPSTLPSSVLRGDFHAQGRRGPKPCLLRGGSGDTDQVVLARAHCPPRVRDERAGRGGRSHRLNTRGDHREGRVRCHGVVSAAARTRGWPWAGA